RGGGGGGRRGGGGARLHHGRTLDGQPERVGLELEEDVVSRRAAIGTERRRRWKRDVGAECVPDLAAAPRDALEHGARDVCAGRGAREPAEDGTCARLHVRGAEPLERRDG